MTDQASEFLKQYQGLAQQAWESWARQLQQPAAAANPLAGFATPDTVLTRSLAGMKGYFDLMQGAAAGGFGQPSVGPQNYDWQQQLQQLFGGSSQPFGQAFAGIDSAAAQSFAQQWQSWLQAAQQGGFGDLRALQPMAPFGLTREQQLQQQALLAATLEYLETSRRHQALLQKANVRAAERLQEILAQRTEPGRQIESIRALYDLWVDAAEASYAEIALSDEFREAYGAMVNAQMRVRELQQQQTEQFCRELGIPTRSEVSSLGQRLQEVRRELRAGGGAGAARADEHAEEIARLRAELAALKRQVQVKPVNTAAVKKPVAKAAAKKTVPARSVAKPRGAAAKKTVVRKPVAKAAARSSARKRK